MEELKALYAKYWPENTGALRGESGVALLRQCLDSEPARCHTAYRQKRDSGGKDVSEKLRDHFFASVPFLLQVQRVSVDSEQLNR